MESDCPVIISRAPVRLSMGGGGTDLPSYYEKFGGFLMAATISKYVYISINKRFYDSIRLSYSKTEIVDSVGQIEHPIFREALQMTQVKNQIEIVSVSDVPSHCGLGTSSVFTVALLNGLYAHRKEYLSLHDLAGKACHLEIQILGQPIGKQDQYAAAFGGFKAYSFNPDGSVVVEPVRISDDRLIELQDKLLLFHTNKERAASEILAQQNKNSQKGDPQTLENLHKIKAIGLQAKEIFEGKDLNLFGELLHEHWLTKKKLSAAVSSNEIDEIYDHARKNGALGGKLVGAGGGGFLMLYCAGDKKKLVSAMSEKGLQPMRFSFEHEGAEIVFRN